MKLFSTFLFLLTFCQIQAQTNCVDVSAETTGISCDGATDGSIDITVSAGTPPYDFLWSNGALTEDIEGLGAGTYSVIITDSLGCVTYFPDTTALGFPILILDDAGTSTIIPKQITQFATNDTLSALDFFEIHVIIEHSWLRDLEISIQCPDGSSAILHDHPSNSGGENHLGIPIENETPPEPGIGWDYWWVNNAKNGTWLEFCNATGAPTVLPVQAYASYDDLESLVGCPLNGEWTMYFTDFWANDQGFVFDWYLKIPGESSGPFQAITVEDSEIDCNPDLAMTNVSAQPISCFGLTDGSACAAATGGIPPYVFTWQNESGFTFEGSCASNLPAGNYSVIVTDAQNTTTPPVLVTIYEPNQIMIDILLVADSTGQNCMPIIDITGGTQPYSSSWTVDALTDIITVNVVDANGCEEEANAMCIIDKTHDIQDLAYFNLSPNPSTGILNVSIGFDNAKTFELKVKNITGQEVLSQQQTQQKLDNQLDLTQQPSGLYFVEIITNRGHVVQKFIIE